MYYIVYLFPSDTNRPFFLESSYGLGCDSHSGWFGVVEATGSCAWEALATPPFVVFSDAGSVEDNSGMTLGTVSKTRLGDLTTISILR